MRGIWPWLGLAALLVAVNHPLQLAQESALTLLSLHEIGPEFDRLSPLHPVVNARLPMQAAQAGRVHIFRPEDGGEEHYAIEIGRPDRSLPVLARLHSACFTGDVLDTRAPVLDAAPDDDATIAAIDAETSCVVVQYPDVLGRVTDLAPIAQAAHDVACRERARHRHRSEPAGAIVERDAGKPAGDDLQLTPHRIHGDEHAAVGVREPLEERLSTFPATFPGTEIGAEGETGLPLRVLEQALDFRALRGREVTSGHLPHPSPRDRSGHLP